MAQQQSDGQQSSSPPPLPLPPTSSVPLTTIILDRFSTMQYFWFRIQHSFQWSQFISFKLSMHFVQLFIRNIYLNCTLAVYAMTATAVAAVAAAAAPASKQPIKQNANAINQLHSALFIKIDANTDNFTGIIEHDNMNLDHALFYRDAANRQTIIQNKQTDQL